MKRFKEILISLEVDNAILSDRKFVDESYDDVLRRKYHLSFTPQQPRLIEANEGKPLVCKGGSIPHGTKLRAKYKGREWYAKVENGRIYIEGDSQPYYSPTDAAIAITKGNVNGWRFWQYEAHTGQPKILSSLRLKR